MNWKGSVDKGRRCAAKAPSLGERECQIKQSEQLGGELPWGGKFAVFVARRFNSVDSSTDSSIRNGLFLGIRNPRSKDRITMPYVAEVIKHIRDRIYDTAY